jgi:hypothetical protein
MRRARSAGRAAGPPCGGCGARDLETIRPGWVEGLRIWLRSGGRWPSSQVCPRCGHVAAAGSAASLARPPGWWSGPARLAGVVRRRRSRVPVPATYLVAAAAGVVLGAVLQVVLGWPWWLVAAGVVVVGWLLFLSSAFWGGSPGRPLATEALLVVDPGRGLRRERQAMAERFRAAPFPLYGLPASWAGPRHLGGAGSRQARGQPAVVTSLTLAHGDPAAEHGPQLRVEVRADPDEPRGGPELRRALTDDLRWVTAARDVPGNAMGGIGRLPADQPDPPWSAVPIRLDGRPVRFELLAEGRHWVAVAEVEGRTLVLQARDLAPEQVELVRVTDVEPYVEGTERLEESRARRGGDGGESGSGS